MLRSLVLKLFLWTIYQIIYPKIPEHIEDTQSGFLQGLGTRETLFSIQVLVQRCRDINCDTFMFFVDFEKVFDKGQHEKMIDVLNNWN